MTNVGHIGSLENTRQGGSVMELTRAVSHRVVCLAAAALMCVMASCGPAAPEPPAPTAAPTPQEEGSRSLELVILYTCDSAGVAESAIADS